MSSSVQDRSTMIIPDVETFVDSFAADVDKGLSDTPKYIPCLYFYDYRGSLLFEDICRLPEYYITRTETDILKTHSEEIISYLPADILLVELGSGSCIKTRLIIEELLNQHDKVTYSPIDISPTRINKLSFNLTSLIRQIDKLIVCSYIIRIDIRRS